MIQFNIGDVIRLKETASSTYREYFTMGREYTVGGTKNNLKVFVNNISGMHGSVEENNWEHVSAIVVGGE